MGLTALNWSQMKKTIFPLILLFLLQVACTKVSPPEPYGPLPSERQLAWHELEYYAFVHFNMNTFSNMEWGFGDEDPALFNPSELDVRQWARVFKEAGMKGIIITAKHHDGFCLWPSAYTEHSVKNSPWRDGKGDLLRELADACREYDLKFGVYLSPWDRNHADYGTPAYLDYFRNQLRELLTNYGEIFEVWFDGANGGNGWYGGANEERKIDNRTYYEWETTFELIRELQPNACIFSDGGPDVRWVGNEEGWARPTNWSLLKKADFAPGIAQNLEHLRAGQEDGTHWIPAEVDVSIRPGWYYHPHEDHKVKTLPQLLDIYYHSVGRNASLLLNFPVDTRGLVHETDVEAVMKLAEALRGDFEYDLADRKMIQASNVRGNSKKYGARNVLGNNPNQYWTTDDGITQASLTIDFGKPVAFNRFLVQEFIPLGQRISRFSVEALSEGNWKTIAEETTIGYKRILRLPLTEASQLRFNILESKDVPVIANLQIFNAPRVLESPKIERNQQGLVTLIAADHDVDVFYTIDGSDPDEQSILYDAPFLLDRKGIIKAIAVDRVNESRGSVVRQEFDLPSTNWRVVGPMGEHRQVGAMFDGNPHTSFNTAATLPTELTIDLGEMVALRGFRYLPDQGRWNTGLISHYELLVSEDGRNFGLPLAEGEFGNIFNSPIFQQVEFSSTPARFIRLRAIREASNANRIGIAEFSIITDH